MMVVVFIIVFMRSPRFLRFKLGFYRLGWSKAIFGRLNSCLLYTSSHADAMIGSKYNDGILKQSVAFESFDDTSYLLVYPCDTCLLYTSSGSMSGYVYFEAPVVRVFSRSVYGTEMCFSAMNRMIAAVFQ